MLGLKKHLGGSSYDRVVDHKQPMSKSSKAKVFKKLAAEKAQTKRKEELKSKKSKYSDVMAAIQGGAQSSQSPAKTSQAKTSVQSPVPTGVKTTPISNTQVAQQTITPQPQPTPTQMAPLSVDEVKQQANNLYYPGLPFEDRVAKLVQDGCTNEQIAMRLDASLKKVMEARKTTSKALLINSPRELFASRLSDFNEAFDTARGLYFDDPSSETNYRVMTEFAKTMRELVKDYQELEDPQEIASVLVQKCIRPLVLKNLKTIVDCLKASAKSITPFLNETTSVQFTDSISASLKSLQSSVNNDYNKSIEVLEQIYNVSLGNLKINKSDAEDIKQES